MGSAVGQVPDYACQITEWVKEAATTPVLIKLTPNITDIRYIARAAVRGGADALSMINTINSITSVDLDTLVPRPAVRGMTSHGGYCGPAVKPIALNMVHSVAADIDAPRRVPISGIGGIQSWSDAVEFMLLGATSVQVCTAVMHYGFRIVEGMIEGMENWMREKNFAKTTDFIGKSLARVADWGDLDLNYVIKASINQQTCIHCGLCYIACEDGCHQSIRMEQRNGANYYEVKEESCVGCNMCMIVCPVEGCITMVDQTNGKAEMSWKQYQKLLAEGKIAPIQPPVHA
jgi:dihydropyrimidine dehydrogenase (NAD+) subunit PreA